MPREGWRCLRGLETPVRRRTDSPHHGGQAVANRSSLRQRILGSALLPARVRAPSRSCTSPQIISSSPAQLQRITSLA